MSEVNKLDMAEVLPGLKKKIKLISYTANEDRLILDTVSLYPDNMAHAFSEASKKLKTRSKTSVTSRYNYLIRKGKAKSPVITGSSAGFSSKKTNKRVKGHFKREEPLQPLIVIFKQLLECDPIQRRKVLEFLKSIE